MEQRQFILYLRVSTKDQGDSGLGLEAQALAIKNYVNSVGGVIIADFTDVLTGTNKEKISVNQKISIETLLSKRPQLLKAIHVAQDTNATIVVRTLDRLSRFSFLIEYLLKCNVNFVVSESPNDNPLMLKIRASIAEEEVRNIADKTYAAHQQIKLRGYTKSGKPCGNHLTRAEAKRSGKMSMEEASALGRKNSAIVRHTNALSEQAIKVAKLVDELLPHKPFTEIVPIINQAGFRTNGGKEFQADNLRRIYRMVKAS